MAFEPQISPVTALADAKPNLRRRSPLRFGIVAAQDVAKHYVRVQFADLDGVQSYWLQVPRRRCKLDHDAELPDVGDQVACLMDDTDEAGVVLGAVTSTEDPPPGGFTKDLTYRDWSDGAKASYDRAAHKLEVELPNGGTVDVAIAGSDTHVVIDKNGVQVLGDAIVLAAAGGPAVARVGDTVQVPNVQAGSDTVTGTIVSGSAKATCA